MLKIAGGTELRKRPPSHCTDNIVLPLKSRAVRSPAQFTLERDRQRISKSAFEFFLELRKLCGRKENLTEYK